VSFAKAPLRRRLPRSPGSDASRDLANYRRTTAVTISTRTKRTPHHRHPGCYTCLGNGYNPVPLDKAIHPDGSVYPSRRIRNGAINYSRARGATHLRTVYLAASWLPHWIASLTLFPLPNSLPAINWPPLQPFAATRNARPGPVPASSGKTRSSLTTTTRAVSPPSPFLAHLRHWSEPPTSCLWQDLYASKSHAAATTA
ncbi:hypothetical protein BD626DRAFT_474430, partial [Schizophyllum amplum]